MIAMSCVSMSPSVNMTTVEPGSKATGEIVSGAPATGIGPQCWCQDLDVTGGSHDKRGQVAG